MSKQFLRNARIWVSTVNTAHGKSDTFEVQVKDDLTWNQGNSTSTVEISEAGATPTRSSKEFNDSLDPVDWSFSTYIRPYLSTHGPDWDPDDNVDDEDLVVTPDALLWQGLSSGSDLDIIGSKGVQSDATEMKVDFLDNAHHELLKLQLYVLADNIWYLITDVQVGEAAISNDISAIGETAWSGQGTTMTKLSTAPFVLTDVTSVSCSLAAPFIKNKLTVLKIKDKAADKAYTVPITGGSVTISNNITYLTPSTLSCLDVPIGSFTGAFNVEGELTAYLDDQIGGTAELLDDVVTARSVTNDFEISVIMGGEYATGAPVCIIHLVSAQVRIPEISTEDVMGVTVSFTSNPDDAVQGKEVVLGMSPTYTTAEIAAFILANS